MADELLTSDYKCPICLELLIEPVVMPCKHELCGPCFRHIVEEANFVCPICRKRIASWARKCNREGTLVNQKRWNLIQKLFPERCLKRLKGEAGESEDELNPAPRRILAKSGELRQEYEEEMNKILEVKEKEQKASEELIKNLLDEEKALQLQKQSQQRDDELLARTIAVKLERVQDDGEGPSTKSSVNANANSESTSSEKYKGIKKRKKMVSDSKHSRTSYTLDKYFTKESETGRATNVARSMSDEKHSVNEDFKLAEALQKQFDKEATAFRKRDEYMLRKTIQNEDTFETTENNNSPML